MSDLFSTLNKLADKLTLEHIRARDPHTHLVHRLVYPWGVLTQCKLYVYDSWTTDPVTCLECIDKEES